MAIAIRGTALSSFANNGGDATLNLSGLSLQENDVVVISCAAPRVTGNTPAVVSAGWTQVVTPHLGSGTNKISIGAWYKRMGATPDGSVVVSGDGSANTDTTIIGIAFSGVDTTTALDQTPTTAGETASTNPNPSSIVTQTNGAEVIVIAGMADNVLDSAVTPPSGYSNNIEINGSDTQDHTHALASKNVASAGTEDPASWTNWNTGSWYTITLALKPALTVNTVQFADASLALTSLGSTNTKLKLDTAFVDASLALTSLTSNAKLTLAIPFADASLALTSTTGSPATVSLEDDFSDNDFTNNPTWTPLTSGDWSISTAVENDILGEDNDYALLCTGVGDEIHADCTQAYGVWEIDWRSENMGNGDRYIKIVTTGTAITSDGYILIISWDGDFSFRRYYNSGGSFLTLMSGALYFATDVWYRIKIVRNSYTDEFVTGAKGTFAIYAKSGSGSYSLITANVSGSNPSTADDYYTSGSYFGLITENANERFSNIYVADGYGGAANLDIFTFINFADTLALDSLTSSPKLSLLNAYADTLNLTSLTSDANLSTAGIYDFSDTLNLTSLTSDAKLNKLIAYADTLGMTSLTSNAKLSLLSAFADTLALSSLTSDAQLRIFITFADTLNLTSLTSDASFRRIMQYTDTANLTSLTSDVKLTLLKVFSDTIALSSLTSSAKLSLIASFTDTLNLTSLTSSPGLVTGTLFNFADTLGLTSLTSSAKLKLISNFSDTLNLTSLTSNAKLYKWIEFLDALNLTSLTSTPTLTTNNIVSFADTLALSSLTSDAKITLVKNYSDLLNFTSLTSDAKMTKLIAFSDAIGLTSLTSNANLTTGSIIAFSDTLGLTSLTSDPKLLRIFPFSDTVNLSSLTSNPAFRRLMQYVDTLNLTSLTSNPKMFKTVAYSDTLGLTSLMSSPNLTMGGIVYYTDTLNLTSLTNSPVLTLSVVGRMHYWDGLNWIQIEGIII